MLHVQFNKVLIVLAAACSACADEETRGVGQGGADQEGAAVGGDNGPVSSATPSASTGVACAGTPPSTALDADDIAHACGHLNDGPFGELSDGDDLVNIHMLYTLQLTPNGNGGFEGSFPFTSRDDATHVFMSVDAEVPLRFEAGGAPRCHAESTPDGCDGIARAAFVDLAEGETVTLGVGPVSTETVRLLGERH